MIIRMSRQTQFLSSTLSEGENTISRRGKFLFSSEQSNIILFLTVYTLASVYIFSILLSCIFYGADKENLFINQKLL